MRISNIHLILFFIAFVQQNIIFTNASASRDTGVQHTSIDDDIVEVASLDPRYRLRLTTTSGFSSPSDATSIQQESIRLVGTEDTTNSASCNFNDICDKLEDSISCPEDCNNIQLSTLSNSTSFPNNDNLELSSGIIFSIKSKSRKLVITSLDITVSEDISTSHNTNKTTIVEVYTKLGSYRGYEVLNQNNDWEFNNDWELIYNESISELHALENDTGVSSSSLDGLHIPIANDTLQSFYIYTSNPVLYSNEASSAGNVEGSLYANDSMLEIYEGIDLDTLSPGRAFSGTIKYGVGTVEEEITWPAFTSSPTPEPTNSTWLTTSSPTPSPIYQTDQPSKAPSTHPSVSPTSSPSKRPTRRPTLRPTQPKITKKISFLVMGDTPYTKEARYCLNRQLRDIDQSQMDFKFLAHVGDLKWGKTKCYSSSFKDVAEIVSHSKNAKGYDTRDFFIVPGDNDFQDCQDQFTNGSAWKWFMQYFGNGNRSDVTGIGQNKYGFGTLSNPNMQVSYQQQPLVNGFYPHSASNFAFFTNSVLFVGINQVDGGALGDESTRVHANYLWVRDNMAQYKEKGMRVLIIFSHANLYGARRDYFGTPFMRLMRNQYRDVLALYIHGSGHYFRTYSNSESIPNLMSLQVDQGHKADPLQLSVMYDIGKDEYSIEINKRGGYYENGCRAGNTDKTWSSSY